MKFSFISKNTPTNQLIRYSILFYWSIFWLFNIVDKIIGGSLFLWVGRDRFAQFQKFFASAGLESPSIANFALIIAAGLEVFAFCFFYWSIVLFSKEKNRNFPNLVFHRNCFYTYHFYNFFYWRSYFLEIDLNYWNILYFGF